MSHKKGPALLFQIVCREFIALVKLNLIFLLFFLPVITIPAAFMAMGKVTMLMVRDEPYSLWSDFFDALKSEFVRATIMGWVAALLCAVSWYGMRISRANLEQGTLFYATMLISPVWGCAALLAASYAFRQMALLRLAIGQIVKNAMILLGAKSKAAIHCLTFDTKRIVTSRVSFVKSIRNPSIEPTHKSPSFLGRQVRLR